MGLMEHREPNQVKWVGIRPGHKGEQVLENLRSIVVSEQILYTVPVGKTFYLTFAFLGHFLVGAGSLTMRIFDATPALWKTIYVLAHPANTSGVSVAGNFWPPIELPPEYSIRISQSANIDMLGSIHGWIE